MAEKFNLYKCMKKKSYLDIIEIKIPLYRLSLRQVKTFKVGYETTHNQA
jgi:hypothetical protein